MKKNTKSLEGSIRLRWIAAACMLALILLGAYVFWANISLEEPSFWGCDLKLSSDKQHYSVGDPILLTFTITSPDDRVVTVLDPMANSVSISPLGIPQATSNSVPSKITRLELHANKPISIQIRGEVRSV